MLLSIIRQNQKLAAKRNPAFDRNRFAKFLIYFMVAFWAAYLIFIGVMLSFAFEDIFPSMEPYHIMNQGLIYLLILDFLLRFMLQPAMSQEIKPYLLMPVKKNKLDPTAFQVADISETSVCPLARVVRRELKKRGIVRGVKVVYSREPAIFPEDGSEKILPGKHRTTGSIAFVPSVAGMIIAGTVVKDIAGV